MDVFEAMGSAASMRWLKPDPVDDATVERLLWAATRASNPGNSQPWSFVVVRHPDVRRAVASIITSAYGPGVRASTGDGASYPDDTQRRIMHGVRHLIDNLGDIPVLVLVCGRNVYPRHAPDEAMMLSAAHNAAQNLLVAARALGIGAAYTTFHNGVEADIKQRLAIPDDVRICVTVPVGHPARPFPTLTRQPLEAVVHYDGW